MVSLEDPRILDYLQRTAGDQGIVVAKLLAELGEATDTEMAERLQSKPSHVRKVLYDLYEGRIAEYYQKKDKDTGWQTFHWKLNLENALRNLDNQHRKELETLEAQLKLEEETQFFVCKQHADQRLAFEKASEAGFRCATCGEPLEAVDKAAIVRQLREQIAALKREGPKA